MSSQSQVISKNHCPICFQPVGKRFIQCMTCKQKIDEECEIKWNHTRKPYNRVLIDDIFICPVCKGDSIADSSYLDDDINADIKEAVQKEQSRRGGKKRKSRKTSKYRKYRKTRKTKK